MNDVEKVENVLSVLGSSISLDCFADGNPTPDIVWSKDNNILSNDDTLAINGSLLELTNIDLSHNGSYICEASNIAGKVSKTFHVTVNSKLQYL